MQTETRLERYMREHPSCRISAGSEDGYYLEMRNCPCGSTLCIEQLPQTDAIDFFIT